ncbi:transmembrane amino acid transporter protein-domain-containing protein [Leucosporidium creatinivorum]|uniref:Transmembrane amino acid transporter protein-domain-containing protein n=1 Tax=Leucosporidium creatinivorum TaxID=106004 RepID=A0A1Y2G2I9_9BASI|nr:transmembrane amino acid transporter protein-domain-containing protein [Leucosporidium creatinivorum]
MDSLFNPRKAVHFALDSDEEDHLPTTTTSPQPSTSRLDQHHSPSTHPNPTTTSPSTAYSDDPASPLFDLDQDDDPSHQDETSYYPPAPLKSTYPSREAQFDLDSDDIDTDEHEQLEEPLMEGLLHKRGSSERSRRAQGEAKDLEREGGDEPPDWLTKGAGVFAGIANMSNSILGAGIIGLPYALREAGFVMGLILLVVLGCVTDWTIRLIVLNAKMSGRKTYIDIMDTCFGPRGRAAVSFFQFAFAFGGMCAFCVILGDTIPHVLVAILPSSATESNFISFLISRQFVITFLTLAVSYPLSLYRDIEKLSKASALALVSMVFIVISVGVRGPGVEDYLKGDPSERWTFVRSGFFEAIGVISFAFVCHHNSLLIYGSLRVPTLDRFAQVTHVSTALSVIACLCMSTSGFLVFTDKTPGNILNAFSEDDTLINIARAFFGANMFATLPLEAFVCREVLENYFWPEDEYDQKRHVVITTGIVLSSMMVSLMTCDLGLILELAGGFSATALAYLFPAACYLKLTSGATRPNGKTPRMRLWSWACAGFGIMVMVLSTALSIKKSLSGTSHKVC